MCVCVCVCVCVSVCVDIICVYMVWFSLLCFGFMAHQPL